MALGLGLGLAAWGVLAAMGLGAVLVSSEWALTALRIAGGAYLLWLAVQSGRQALRPVAARPLPPSRAFLRGLLLNLSNPKAVLAWLAALSMGLGPDSGVVAVAGATALCALVGFANYLLWAAAFSGPMMRGCHAAARRWIDGAAALLLGAAGLGVIRQAIAR
jgi:threonine/homoserine/homoserine lactone efflux protein